jgi:hypothetical protein
MADWKGRKTQGAVDNVNGGLLETRSGTQKL